MKKTSFLLVFTLFLTVFPSCLQKNIHTRDVVYAMTDGVLSPIAGSVYTTDSSEGSSDFLSPELLSELYGDGIDLSCVRGAVYLSDGVSLFEMAVFDCPDTGTAEALGGACAIRFSVAEREARKLGLDTPDSTVKLYGNYVLAAMCDGSEAAIDAALEKIKG